MEDRSILAAEIARTAGELALNYFRNLGNLAIEDKGHQDFVSEADKAVEALVREKIEEVCPEDGIVGEEDAPKPSRSGYTWVIDPIDGTTNFISGIPAWTVVIAVVRDDRTQIGATFDPIHDELFLAVRGHGATLNGEPLVCPSDTVITRGSIGTGFSNRISGTAAVALITNVLSVGGVFHRNASGALSIAYVAAGRLVGYVEEHMNAWDCLAGQLLVEEAGGRVEAQSADEMMARGGRVVVGGAGVFDTLVTIADKSYAG
ncbi:MAG: inositol monophosphatase [Pseudomonadota bacterium]